MPVWHNATKAAVKSGKLVLLGVTQEQHPDRCRLFAQWQQFDWPILHDPITQLGTRVVPIITAIDEHGIVRSTRPSPRTFGRDFLEKEFPKPKNQKKPQPFRKPSGEEIRRDLVSGTEASSKRAADRAVVWARSHVSLAVTVYRAALKKDSKDATTWFRLGVALRYRYETKERKPGDFRDAVQAWTKAVELNPNQYIWRRRIQQYGPRLIKPYPFYDWVAQAEKDIRGRGAKPVALTVRPSGAEIARPARRFGEESDPPKNPDPNAKIDRDQSKLVEAEAVVVPSTIRAGQAVRLHVTLRPSKKTHWSNEAGATSLWIDVPKGWQIERRLQQANNTSKGESSEVRTFEVELRSPRDAKTTTLSAYALYYVCEDAGGKCLFLRRDLRIPLRIK